MKKRMFSLFLALTLCLSLLPTGAWAAEPQSEEETASMQQDGEADAASEPEEEPAPAALSAQTAASTEETISGNVTWDNRNITTPVVVKGDTTITLIGENTITITETAYAAALDMYSASLTIQGSGSLTVTVPDRKYGIADSAYSDTTGGTLTIKGGAKITTNGGRNGLSAKTIVIEGGNLNLNSNWGIVTASLTMNGGTLYATGKSGAFLKSSYGEARNIDSSLTILYSDGQNAKTDDMSVGTADDTKRDADVKTIYIANMPAPAWAEEADAPEGGAPAADEQPAVQSEPAPQAAEAAVQAAEVAVAEVNGVNYDDIQKAFDAVKQSNGGTLTLLANCETPDTSKQFDISGNYTLDLNSCTLKGRLYLSKTSTSLTVKDSGTGGKIQATAGWSPLWVDGGDVTIESGTLATERQTGQALVFGQEAACGTLTINGGVFKTGYVQIVGTGGTTVITGGAFHDLRVNGDSKRVTLSGGTFDTVERRKNGSTIAPADLLADGYTFVDRGTGAEVSTSQVAALTNVKVVSKETANASASLTVNGTETPYGTFEDALTAAQQTQGGTLTLLNNVNLVTQVFVNRGTFTLDLNGHMLTSEDFNTMIVNGGSLTIQDSAGKGELGNNSKDDTAVWCVDGTVTVLSGSITSKLVWESGTVSLQGGAFRSLNRTDGSWLSAIPEGKALERDGQITDASAKTIIAPTGFYVLADHEKHDWQAGKCACGREHTDHKWEGGKCTVCHLPCSHGTIDGDGMCKTCGTQFAVRDDDGNYYKHLADALAKSSVDRVTLVADDTLSEDVTLIQDNIFFYPNGHTVSGEGAIVVPSGKWLELREEDETEKAGNAGAIRVEDGGTLMVGEDFTGTVQTLTVSEQAEVKLLGGTYRTITGSREKAGTLLYDGDNRALAFKKQDGSFARYDQRISSETPLENVTVDFCRHEQLTEACDGACEYCNGALGARIGSQGYWNLNTEGDGAVCNVKNGETIVLLKDSDPKFGSSLNSDCAYTIDLKGHSTIKGWTVSAGAPKIIDSKGGGKISRLSIDSSLDLTLADLLPKGWDFQKSDGSWLSTTELEGKTASNVTVAQLPIQSMNYPTEMSMTYGGAGTLLVNVKSTGAVTFQWYKVEDGKETAVGSATPKSQFNLAEQKLSAGKHIFRFSATCDGYQKMSQDIVITVQKADIGSNRITPPTAQENLTYTGREQALITAGSVTDYGTMQYSLTENGTYSQDIPTGTDAGAYTVWYRVIGDANHNDTEPASVAVSIGKKPLTITGVTAASKPYDGTTNAGITSVTFDNVTLNRGTDYTVTASFDDASVGNGKNITATVTLMEQTAKNYALEQSSFTTTGSITKVAAPDFTKETALTIINDCEKTYTVTLPALPTLETPKEYGALTYEISEIKLDGGYYTGGAKVENGKLTLPIQKNDVETTSSVGTVTVVIKSTNYEDITLTVNVNATNKLVPTVTAPTANALTYNGAEQALVTAGKTTGGTMLYRLDDSEWSEQIPTAKNAGEYTVWYKVQGNAEYADVAEQSVIVTVAKKAVTVTVLDKSAYTGSTAPDLSSPEADKDYKVEGLVGADTLSGTVTLAYAQTPDMGKTGETAINITGTLSNDNYEITYVPGTLTVSNRPSGGGGGGSSTPSVSVPVSSDHGGTKLSATISGSTATVSVSGKEIDKVIADGAKSVTVDLSGLSKVDSVKLPASVIAKTEDAEDTGLTIRLPDGAVELDEAALESIASGKTLTVSVQQAKLTDAQQEVVSALAQVAVVVDVDIVVGTVKQSAFNGGRLTISIPYTPEKGEDTSTLAVWYIRDDGSIENKGGSYDAKSGCFVFETDHLSRYLLVHTEQAMDFTDVPADAWYAGAVAWAVEQGITSGTSDTTFSPNVSCTRAQMVTFLWRASGSPKATGVNPFIDVSADAYYYDAVLWAAEKGITSGTTATTFSPDTTLTRSQTVTFLWRANGSPVVSGGSFGDVAADAYYANAVAWAVFEGITSGTGGNNFNPDADCTRAQIVTFMYRDAQ